MWRSSGLVPGWPVPSLLGAEPACRGGGRITLIRTAPRSVEHRWRRRVGSPPTISGRTVMLREAPALLET